MITGPLRSKIDKLWSEFWTGGITNPLTVIEQISFLMSARLTNEGIWSYQILWQKSQIPNAYHVFA